MPSCLKLNMQKFFVKWSSLCQQEKQNGVQVVSALTYIDK